MSWISRGRGTHTHAPGGEHGVDTTHSLVSCHTRRRQRVLSSQERFGEICSTGRVREILNATDDRLRIGDRRTFSRSVRSPALLPLPQDTTTTTRTTSPCRSFSYTCYRAIVRNVPVTERLRHLPLSLSLSFCLHGFRSVDCRHRRLRCACACACVCDVRSCPAPRVSQRRSSARAWCWPTSTRTTGPSLADRSFSPWVVCELSSTARSSPAERLRSSSSRGRRTEYGSCNLDPRNFNGSLENDVSHLCSRLKVTMSSTEGHIQGGVNTDQSCIFYFYSTSPPLDTSDVLQAHLDRLLRVVHQSL